MPKPRFTRLAFLALLGSTLTSSSLAQASDRSLEDYRYFRALSIDLAGRIPSRAEIAAFEKPDFDVDRYIDDHLGADGYVERIQRIYLDALRLEVNDNSPFRPPTVILRRYPVDVREANGTITTEWVYFRGNQLRANAALNRKFCFDASDTGQTYQVNRPPDPEVQPTPVPRATFDARTKRVKPWWLYRDYRKPAPQQLYASWRDQEARFVLDVPSDPKGAVNSASDLRLLVDARGNPVTDVAVCSEEAQTADTATSTVRGSNATVSCASDIGLTYAKECGCGVGLERCMPGASPNQDPRGLVLPTLAPLGPSEPFESSRLPQSRWWAVAWAEEARAFLAMIVGEDRDFREVLTARGTMVNGPLAQFYRGAVLGDSADLVTLGTGTTYIQPETTFDVSAVPNDLLPFEMDRWVKVPDRGARAAGILTTAAYLAKFASRRGRAHAAYTTFQCRELVAENLKLEPSTEPNLTIRPGCSTCHATLEPLAAYFARTKESGFAWIPTPIDNPLCPLTSGTLSGSCKRYYDPDFSTASSGKLRGAHVAADHVDQGPAGLGQAIAASPEFSTCATQRVTESLLGRELTSPDDDALRSALGQTFVDGGYRLRALVRAVVKSGAYRFANSRRSGGDK